MEFKEITKPEVYKGLVGNFSWLVDKELTKLEIIASQKDWHALAIRMPPIISLINVVGYLRGQDNIFLDFRPSVLDFQKELYENEDAFEKRLWNLINLLLGSDQKEEYKNALLEYYINYRGLR